MGTKNKTVTEAEQVVKEFLIREHAIRGMFSFLASASLLYMASEYAEYATLRKNRAAIPIALACLGLATLEASKVGSRVERILKLYN